ncbi:putative Chromosome-associated kinesin KIF4 [Blattamonas nauphoetae]|uniref:Chromosome-associated kinesin KIF4 n=1 Tax=Blattamonas nauphoetae TaxID=2049346 RepID=A0ABQ9XMS0_9EUKA|nr:putative Chromosome-associated kinesin KIF4 [Blattamonas nauphoetae]
MIKRPLKELSYSFDAAFDADSDNYSVFSYTTAPLIEKVIQGYNATCFAYGMTGSGKTYTMMGDLIGSGNDGVKGIYTYAAEMIFDQIQSASEERDFIVTVSFVEIYNEQVKDLLRRHSANSIPPSDQKSSRRSQSAPQGMSRQNSFITNKAVSTTANLQTGTISNNPLARQQGSHLNAPHPLMPHSQQGSIASQMWDYSPSLEIQEDPIKGVMLVGVTEIEVKSVDNIQQLIHEGNQRRKMASTDRNLVSSRSHAVLTVRIESRSKHRDIVESILIGKLNLIDLAGSERAEGSTNTGIRMREGANINKSLLALGNCINALSAMAKLPPNSKRSQFVPYRSSKLTRLLKDSLGGNTKTVMIATVSPSAICYDETRKTLEYAARAKDIRKTIKINQVETTAHITHYKEIIQSLTERVAQLESERKEEAMRQSHLLNSIDLFSSSSEAYDNFRGKKGWWSDDMPLKEMWDMSGLEAQEVELDGLDKLIETALEGSKQTTVSKPNLPLAFLFAVRRQERLNMFVDSLWRKEEPPLLATDPQQPKTPRRSRRSPSSKKPPELPISPISLHEVSFTAEDSFQSFNLTDTNALASPVPSLSLSSPTIKRRPAITKPLTRSSKDQASNKISEESPPKLNESVSVLSAPLTRKKTPMSTSVSREKKTYAQRITEIDARPKTAIDTKQIDSPRKEHRTDRTQSATDSKRAVPLKRPSLTPTDTAKEPKSDSKESDKEEHQSTRQKRDSSKTKETKDGSQTDRSKDTHRHHSREPSSRSSRPHTDRPSTVSTSKGTDQPRSQKKDEAKTPTVQLSLVDTQNNRNKSTSSSRATVTKVKPQSAGDSTPEKKREVKKTDEEKKPADRTKYSYAVRSTRPKSISERRESKDDDKEEERRKRNIEKAALAVKRETGSSLLSSPVTPKAATPTPSMTRKLTDDDLAQPIKKDLLPDNMDRLNTRHPASSQATEPSPVSPTSPSNLFSPQTPHHAILEPSLLTPPVQFSPLQSPIVSKQTPLRGPPSHITSPLPPHPTEVSPIRQELNKQRQTRKQNNVVGAQMQKEKSRALFAKLETLEKTFTERPVPLKRTKTALTLESHTLSPSLSSSIPLHSSPSSNSLRRQNTSMNISKSTKLSKDIQQRFLPRSPADSLSKRKEIVATSTD